MNIQWVTWRCLHMTSLIRLGQTVGWHLQLWMVVWNKKDAGVESDHMSTSHAIGGMSNLVKLCYCKVVVANCVATLHVKVVSCHSCAATSHKRPKIKFRFAFKKKSELNSVFVSVFVPLVKSKTWTNFSQKRKSNFIARAKDLMYQVLHLNDVSFASLSLLISPSLASHLLSLPQSLSPFFLVSIVLSVVILLTLFIHSIFPIIILYHFPTWTHQV